MPTEKKIPRTDALFARLSELNPEPDQAENVLRLSMDTKATVKIGLFSRGGKNRVCVQAADHDFRPEATLAPVGILLPRYDDPYLYFLRSRVTRDALVDVLEDWWRQVRRRFRKVDTLVLNQDNGPENHSRRTQFMKRLVDFGRGQSLCLRLAYYPPYHSKYNAVERCWGVLENHWNGSLLESVDTTVRFAQTMTWHGKHPLVKLITKTYEKGVALTAKEMNELERHLERLPGLEKWFVNIPTADS